MRGEYSLVFYFLDLLCLQQKLCFYNLIQHQYKDKTKRKNNNSNNLSIMFFIYKQQQQQQKKYATPTVIFIMAGFALAFALTTELLFEFQRT